MKSYITVYKSIGGWKAVLLWWNPEMGGFYEPMQTGLCGYETREEAIEEGKYWAEAEDVEFRAEG
jgi:hypothetical protein